MSYSVSAAAQAAAASSTPSLSVSEMLPAVRSFLRSVYTDPSSIPALEITPHTVSSLYALQAHVHDNDERAAILEEEMREATKEYYAEGQDTAHARTQWMMASSFVQRLTAALLCVLPLT